jgi:hypothetical protein
MSIRSTSMLLMKLMPSMVSDWLLLLPRFDPMPMLYLWVGRSSVLYPARAVSTALVPVASVSVSV